MSPTLFNYYIDDLLEQLELILSGNQGHRRSSKNCQDNRPEDDVRPVLAYADDIALVCSESQLDTVCDAVERWSSINNIQINKNKSLLMRVKVDSRTPQPTFQNFRGIPVGKTYKYLGIHLSDDLRLEQSLAEQTSKVLKLYRTIVNQAAIDSSQRYVAWKTLIESRVFY